MRLPVDAIQVGERRREDLGDIDALAKSIARYGLIHPIVVDDEHRLIAGGRRLEACRRLGQTEVEVRSHGEVSDAELRELELEENIQRKDLTAAERTRNFLERVAIAKEVLTQRAMDDENPRTVYEGSKPGPPPDPTSNVSVAEYLGVSEGAVRKAQAHAEAMDHYPDLDCPTVGQQEAITRAKALDATPDPEQREAMLADMRERQQQAQPPKKRVSRKKASNSPKPAGRQRRSPRTKVAIPAGALFIKHLYGLEETLPTVSGVGLLQMVANWPQDDRDMLLSTVERTGQQLTALVAGCMEAVS